MQFWKNNITGEFHMKLIRISAAIVPVLLFSASLFSPSMALAQNASAYVGVSTITDSSSDQQIDTFGTGSPFTTPKMGGLFGDVGGNFMINKNFGVGAEMNWRFSQAAYAGLNYRPLFYDFNGIWQPMRTSRFVPEIQAGVGGVNLRYSYNATTCDQFAGCTSSNTFLESSNHFQAHFGVAARMYVTPHVFVRPAVDAHWVNNFFQFGSNWVPEYSVGVGYTFGAE
jgi:hypothetical protein